MITVQAKIISKVAITEINHHTYDSQTTMNSKHLLPTMTQISNSRTKCKAKLQEGDYMWATTIKRFSKPCNKSLQAVNVNKGSNKSTSKTSSTASNQQDVAGTAKQ